MHIAAALSVFRLFIIIIVNRQQRFTISCYCTSRSLTPFSWLSETRGRTRSIAPGTERKSTSRHDGPDDSRWCRSDVQLRVFCRGQSVTGPSAIGNNDKKDMNNEDDELQRPSTSNGGLLSDEKTLSEFPKDSLRLNNNIVNGHDDSECCANCVTAAVHDHMIAASLVYCDQEDNEDSDDNYCIYTYRGDRQEAVVAIGSPGDDRSTSPLMDYLEMDFDPEPPPTVGNASEDEDIIVPGPSNHHSSSPPLNVEEPSIPSCSTDNNEEMMDNVVNNLHRTVDTNENNDEIETPISKSPVSSTKLPFIHYNGFSGFKEERNGCIRRNTDTTDVCQKMKRMRVEDLSWTKEMVWLEKDAPNCEVNQIGTSACGATAVINTLLALRIPFNSDCVIQTIGTRDHDEDAPLVPYLESRAVDGCIPEDLVRTLETVSDSLVTARFFATREDLDFPIAPWLADWIKKGAIPILTLNIQRTTVSHSYVPDSWRHQMMYGVAYNPLRPECAQIYLTNPLSQSSMEALRPQLISPSTLLIRRADILSRWTKQTDLMPLAMHSNQHWNTFNVLGQVVNLLREDREDVQFTNHIVIPTGCKSGITLAMRTSSNFSHELKSVPEL